MKFGKYIQAHQVPGWSAYYLDYKFLKKIISSLAANRPASEAAALALGFRPVDGLSQNSPPSDSRNLAESTDGPPIFAVSEQDEDRGPDFQAHKAAFFFKLERELEKINAFYLHKEAELTLRMETLLSKRRAAAMRGFPDATDDTTQSHVEWSAVEEGFRFLERDIGKLQQFIEINATGFRKILKKFDKRSTSSMKELYLTRQVEVQPVFNRQLISEMADVVAACLLDLTDLSSGLKFEGPGANDIFTQQIMSERPPFIGPLHDFEKTLRKAVVQNDSTAISDCVRYSDILAQDDSGKLNVARILWSVVIDAPTGLADLILSSLITPFDFSYVDDINGRTCLHEAAIAGTLRLVNMCIEKGVQPDKLDAYGRSALHYAAMNGHAKICERLLELGLELGNLDVDNCNPIIYAIMRGSVECTKVLLDSGASLLSTGALMPLSLASQAGHAKVATMLIKYGAKSVANTNGEYPMHLAAREGHSEVCKLLLQQEGWDTPDKYHEWTPLFHAVRYGYADCAKILLDSGAKFYIKDELGHLPIHYAAWYGQGICLRHLLDAASHSSYSGVFPTSYLSNSSPLSDVDMSQTSEIDLIPSLSLPPPIMPHRIYGHNYLDRNHLVQITIGHPSRVSSVRLQHRLLSRAFRDEYLLTSSPLKLVMTTSAEVNSAPYTISLPEKVDPGVFIFQIPSLSSLSLEFSIHPNFGTKTIGRAVALPSLFEGIRNNDSFTLPILDHRLHVIGEVTFEVNIITPFEGVTLEVGGDVETYWKSTTVSAVPIIRPSVITGSSAQTSPSTHSISSAASGPVSTISSLKGSYLHVVLQVTQDLHPVVYNEWRLPEDHYALGVSDVTLDQFEALAMRTGRQRRNERALSLEEWHSGSMMSLVHLLKVLPSNIGLALEVVYPSKANRKRLGLNTYVDSILRTLYRMVKRRLVFMSYSPDICSALNWKQPNYPVFYASYCGQPPPAKSLIRSENDRRLSSVGAAVEFARTNNLLGISVPEDLLAQVPSLIDGIRSAGLLVGIHTANNDSQGCSVDFYDSDATVMYVDHSEM